MIDEIWIGARQAMKEEGWIVTERDDAVARATFYSCFFMAFEALPLMLPESLDELRRDADLWLGLKKAKGTA